MKYSINIACWKRIGATIMIMLATSLAVYSQSYTYTQAYLSVNSTTDGQGLYSYTFSLNGSSYIWGVSSNGGDIAMQSYGVLQVFSPVGWAANVDGSGYITWQPTSSDVVYLGQPSLTFSVLSSITNAVLFDHTTYLRGLVSGGLYSLPDHQIAAGGYATFDFLGPEAVPEPSSRALIGMTFALLAASYLIKRKSKPSQLSPVVRPLRPVRRN